MTNPLRLISARDSLSRTPIAMAKRVLLLTLVLDGTEAYVPTRDMSTIQHPVACQQALLSPNDRYSVLTKPKFSVPRARTVSPSMESSAEFRFGNGEPGERTIGFQGGVGQGLGDEPNGRPKPTYLTTRDGFCFGSFDCFSGERTIGFQGGVGQGLGDEPNGRSKPTYLTARDSFCFGVLA